MLDRKLLSCIAGLFMVISSGSGYAAEESTSSAGAPSYLFVESARAAEIQKDVKLDQYRITLENPEDWVVYFSDRPHRDMGFMSLEDFLKTAKKEGAKFTPSGLNAVLISVVDKGKHMTQKYVFTLDAPTFDRDGQKVTFKARAVPNLSEGVLPLPPQGKFKHVTLFIDACVGCVNPP